MAKLTDEVLQQGRSCVIQQDIQGLLTWIARHAPAFDAGRIQKTLRICYAAGDMARAVSFFNTCFSDYDPGVEVWRKVLGCGLLTLLGLTGAGLLGGLGFLTWLVLR